MLNKILLTIMVLIVVVFAYDIATRKDTTPVREQATVLTPCGANQTAAEKAACEADVERTNDKAYIDNLSQFGHDYGQAEGR